MFRSLSPRQIAVDVSVAVVFALLTAVIDRAVSGEGILVALGMGVALSVRRLSPSLALVVAWVTAAGQMLLVLPTLSSDLAIFAVLYATAVYGTRRVFWWGFASAVTGAVVATAYLVAYLPADGVGLRSVQGTLTLLAESLFALLLAWTVGALIRTARRARENFRAQQRAEAEAITEQERVRIARDMHDVLAHSLAVVIAQADGARYSGDQAVTHAALGTIASTARAALADVRLLLTQLRHSEGEGPQPTLADTEALYQQLRAAGVELAVDVDPAPFEPPQVGIQLAVYRILQEALTNALRHGAPAPVTVQLAWHADRVAVRVQNTMRGDAPTPSLASVLSPASLALTPPASASPASASTGSAGLSAPAAVGHGLIGMRERAKLVGGTLTAAAEGDQFVVEASLPMKGI